MPLRGFIAAAIMVPLLGATTAFATDRLGHGNGSTVSKDTQIAGIGYLSPKEREAINFRLLQTELMVAALSCGRNDFKSKYNNFVVRFGPALRRNGRTLRAIFRRAYGHNATRRLDTYVTRLANEASVRSMENTRFCETAGRKLNVVMRARQAETARELLRQTQNP